MFHGASSLKCKDIFRDSSRDDPLDLEQLCSSKMCPGGMAAAWNCSCECRLPSDLCSVALELLHGQGLEDCARASFSLVDYGQNRPSSLVSHTIESSLLFLLPGTHKNASKKAQACIFYSPIFHPVTPYLMLWKSRNAPRCANVHAWLKENFAYLVFSRLLSIH